MYISPLDLRHFHWKIRKTWLDLPVGLGAGGTFPLFPIGEKAPTLAASGRVWVFYSYLLKLYRCLNWGLYSVANGCQLDENDGDESLTTGLAV